MTISLGFLSRPLRRGSFALVTRSAASEATLELAMRRAARTLRAAAGRRGARAGAGGIAGRDGAALQRSVGSAPVFLHEMLLRSLWRLFAWLAGRPIAGGAFRLRVSEPALCRPATARIFPAPLQFDQRRSALWFDAIVAAAAGAPRCGRGAGVPRRRARRTSSCRTARRSGQRTRAQASAAIATRHGPTSPPRPTRCTWRPPRCNGVWRSTARRSRR